MKVWCVFFSMVDEDRDELEALYEKKEDAERHMIEEAHFFSPHTEIKIFQEPNNCFPTYVTNIFGTIDKFQYYMQQFEVL